MVVAAAHVRVDNQIVAWLRRDNSVVDRYQQVHVRVQLFVGGKAGELASHLGVHEAAPGAVVELQVATARRVEIGDELGIRGHHVVGERLDGVVMQKRVLQLLGASEHGIELARSRNGELGHGVFVFLGLHEAEVIDKRMVFDRQLAFDGDGVNSRGFALEGRVARFRFHAGHAVDIPHEVEVPGKTAELAIGDDVQAGGLLFGDEVDDRLILGGFQLVGGKLTALECGAGLAQIRRAQKAANDIVTVGCA